MCKVGRQYLGARRLTFPKDALAVGWLEAGEAGADRVAAHGKLEVAVGVGHAVEAGQAALGRDGLCWTRRITVRYGLKPRTV